MLHQTNLKFNEKLENRASNSTQYIVLHHSEVVTRHTIEDIHKWHLNKKWAGVAYHYYINKDGEIFEGRPKDAVGAHAYGFNQKSVGICFGQKQMDAAVMLSALLSLTYNNAKVIRHSELVKDKDCPGLNFPFDSFYDEVDECKKHLVALFGKDFSYSKILDLI